MTLWVRLVCSGWSAESEAKVDDSQKTRKGWLTRMVVLLHKYKNNDIRGLESDLKWYQEHHSIVPAMHHLEQLIKKHGKDAAYAFYS